MSWWNAVSTCWTPGQNGCVIWWDAWMVVTAIAALAVAFVGVGVTALSAVAVFWLGKQANRLAHTTYNLEMEARGREATFILGYLYAEILYNHTCISRWLEKTPAIELLLVTFEYAEMQEMVTELGELLLPQTEALFGRLHVIDASIGVRLARAVSMLQLVRVARNELVGEEDDAAREEKFGILKSRATQALEDLDAVLKAGAAAQDLR